MMPDKITLVNKTSLQRIIIPSSFVTTIDSKTLPAKLPIVDFLLAEFRVGRGGWIFQAKATIRSNSPENVDVQFRLTAEGDTTVLDAAKASANNFGYATVLAVVGVHVSTTAKVKLELTEQGNHSAELSGIVITAIHQDNLDIIAM